MRALLLRGCTGGGSPKTRDDIIVAARGEWCRRSAPTALTFAPARRQLRARRPDRLPAGHSRARRRRAWRGPPRRRRPAVRSAAHASDGAAGAGPGCGPPHLRQPWIPRNRSAPPTLRPLDGLRLAAQRGLRYRWVGVPTRRASWRRGPPGRRGQHDGRHGSPRRTPPAVAVGSQPPAPGNPQNRMTGAQAVRRVRPWERRAEMIARPARVRIRSRKPCVFARRRLFGWYVRLLTGGSVVVCFAGGYRPRSHLTSGRRSAPPRYAGTHDGANAGSAVSRRPAVLWTAVERLWTTLLTCPFACSKPAEHSGPPGVSRRSVGPEPTRRSLVRHDGSDCAPARSRYGECTRSGSTDSPSVAGDSLIHKLWITCGLRNCGSASSTRQGRLTAGRSPQVGLGLRLSLRQLPTQDGARNATIERVAHHGRNDRPGGGLGRRD